jgi:hypothetical protein
MTGQQRAAQVLPVRDDHPLVGVIVREHGQDVTHYVVDEQDTDAAEAVRQAKALAGAWRDLDWDEAVAELDRIRHESEPTAPIEP